MTETIRLQAALEEEILSLGPGRLTILAQVHAGEARPNQKNHRFWLYNRGWLRRRWIENTAFPELTAKGLAALDYYGLRRDE